MGSSEKYATQVIPKAIVLRRDHRIYTNGDTVRHGGAAHYIISSDQHHHQPNDRRNQTIVRMTGMPAA